MAAMSVGPYEVVPVTAGLVERYLKQEVRRKPSCSAAAM